jgi:hypothetical protein
VINTRDQSFTQILVPNRYLVKGIPGFIAAQMVLNFIRAKKRHAIVLRGFLRDKKNARKKVDNTMYVFGAPKEHHCGYEQNSRRIQLVSRYFQYESQCVSRSIVVHVFRIPLIYLPSFIDFIAARWVSIRLQIPRICAGRTGIRRIRRRRWRSRRRPQSEMCQTHRHITLNPWRVRAPLYLLVWRPGAS